MLGALRFCWLWAASPTCGTARRDDATDRTLLPLLLARGPMAGARPGEWRPGDRPILSARVARGYADRDARYVTVTTRPTRGHAVSRDIAVAALEPMSAAAATA